MSLVLAMRVGQDFYVGDNRVVVAWCDSPFRFGLKRGDGTTAVVTDDKWAILFPGVRVQAGIPRNADAKKLVKVQFDAPGVSIVRGALYRNLASTQDPLCGTCHGTGELHARETCPNCSGFGCSKCMGGMVATSFKCPDCNKEKQ